MRLIFPIALHDISVKDFGSIKKKLIKFVYEQKEKDPNGVTFSNRGGWQSHSSYYSDDNLLISTITKSLTSYFNENNLKKPNKKLAIDALWMNVNRKGDYNNAHHHPRCHLAGVFWIKTPSKCGNLEFMSPHSFTMSDEIMMYSEEFHRRTSYNHGHWVPPQEGTILLFPACLMHKVEPSESDEDRISASFNLRVI